MLLFCVLLWFCVCMLFCICVVAWFCVCVVVWFCVGVAAWFCVGVVVWPCVAWVCVCCWVRVVGVVSRGICDQLCALATEAEPIVSTAAATARDRVRTLLMTSSGNAGENTSGRPPSAPGERAQDRGKFHALDGTSRLAARIWVARAEARRTRRKRRR